MEWYIWPAFISFIVAILLVDLFVLHRNPHEVSAKEAALWSAFWITLGVSFALVLWAWQGGQAAGEYMGGYLIEKSLSIDNIFVFALIFEYFRVPGAYRHRVLFWGIFGALVMRFAFIMVGVQLVERFEVTLIVFGVFLLYTAWKMYRHSGAQIDPENNPLMKAVRKRFAMTESYRGAKLFVKENGKRLATPLFAVLVLVEASDVIFAVDSIPAIFAITTDPFLVFSANAFAILGLRSLYFLLADSMKRFRYLNHGLAAILAVVGFKMVSTWHVLPWSDFVHDLPIWVSLVIISVIITVSIVASLLGAPQEVDDEVSHLPIAGALAGYHTKPRPDEPQESPSAHRDQTR